VSVFRTLGGSWSVVPSLPSWVYYRSTGPSFDALWACVPLSIDISLHVHIVPNVFSLDPSVVSLASPCTCWWKDRITLSCSSHMYLLVERQNHPIVRFAYLCHMIGVEFVFLSFLYIKLFELGVEVAFRTTDPRIPTTKLVCSNFHLGAAASCCAQSSALSAPIMLLCCSFASAFLTSRNSSSLSVDRLNSKIYTICRALLIATPPDRLPQIRFTKKDTGSKFYRVSWLFCTGIVISISCAFCTRSSLLQILRNSSRRHSVLRLCYFLCQTWQTWACFLAFVQSTCRHAGASRWSGLQP